MEPGWREPASVPGRGHLSSSRGFLIFPLFFWHQPCPQFLKLKPFFRLEQRQDSYFWFFFLRGGAPALSLPAQQEWGERARKGQTIT